MNQTKEALRVHIRWLIRRDMPEVLEIEHQCFEYFWVEEDFIQCLRQRNCIGMIAEHQNQVVSHMIYTLCKSKLHLLNLAVAKRFWRYGIGEQMVDKLKSKLSPQRREKIVLEVLETNLAAQHFFAACGFRAVKILRDHYREEYPGMHLEAYFMQYHLPRIHPSIPKRRYTDLEKKAAPK